MLKIKLIKPTFWMKNNTIIPLLLLPFAILFQIYNFLKKNLIKNKKFDLKVICVGNIYLGGTGKTPLSINLASLFQNENYKVSIIKKNYRDQIDEKELIEKEKIKLFFSKTRRIGLQEAQDEKYDIAILDDGFQDYSIHKNLNILCFNSNQLVGNGFTLPSGPLREPFRNIRECKIVVINGKENIKFEEKIKKISNDIEIFYSKYVIEKNDINKNKKYLAFAGIGNPENFFETLDQDNFLVEKKLSFPDHHHYTIKDYEYIANQANKYGLSLLTTEKDFCRIEHNKLKDLKYLKINLEIINKESFKKLLLDHIR